MLSFLKVRRSFPDPQAFLSLHSLSVKWGKSDPFSDCTRNRVPWPCSYSHNLSLLHHHLYYLALISSHKLCCCHV